MCYYIDICPNKCTGHGSCTTLKDMSLLYGPDYDNTLVNGGDGIGTEYSNWDSESVMLCNCDSGFSGPDCSMSKLNVIYSNILVLF